MPQDTQIMPLANPDVGERLLYTSINWQISVRNPEKYPYINRLVSLLREHKWRQGILFAYLLERFPDHTVRHAQWKGRSLGPNGIAGKHVLSLMPQNPEWIEIIHTWKHGNTDLAELPLREAVYLGWLLENLPPCTEFSTPEFDEAIRIRPTSSDTSIFKSNFRKMWRGKSI